MFFLTSTSVFINVFLMSISHAWISNNGDLPYWNKQTSSWYEVPKETWTRMCENYRTDNCVGHFWYNQENNDHGWTFFFQACEIIMKRDGFVTLMDNRYSNGWNTLSSFKVGGAALSFLDRNLIVRDPKDMPSKVFKGEAIRNIGPWDPSDWNYGWWIICFSESKPIQSDNCYWEQWCDDDQYAPVPGITSYAPNYVLSCGFLGMYRCTYCCDKATENEEAMIAEVQNATENEEPMVSEVQTDVNCHQCLRDILSANLCHCTEEGARCDDSKEPSSCDDTCEDFVAARCKASGYGNCDQCLTDILNAKLCHCLKDNARCPKSKAPSSCNESCAKVVAAGCKASEETIEALDESDSIIGLLTSSPMQYVLAFIGMITIIWKACSIFKRKSEYIGMN